MSVWRLGSARVGESCLSSLNSKNSGTRDPPLLLNSLLDDNRASNLPTVHEEAEKSAFSSLYGNSKAHSRLDESSIEDPSSHILIEDKAKSASTGEFLKRQANKYNRALWALHAEHSSYTEASERTIRELKLEVSTIKHTQETELEKFKTQVVRALRNEIAEVKATLNARRPHSALRKENQQLRGELARLWKDYGRDQLAI